MAIHRTLHKAKLAKPRSPIFILVASIASIAVLYLLSSLFSTNGFSFSTPRNIQKFASNPKNRHTLHEKYLYWGNRIDCPGKHCDTCAGLGHQESSLRCAIEEALFLGRTFIMPCWMCLKPIHNNKGILHQSDDMVSEKSGQLAPVLWIFRVIWISYPIRYFLDNSKTWHHVLTSSMKLESRGVANVQGLSRIDLKEKNPYSCPLAW